MSKIFVVVTDDRYGNYDIEKNILKELDAEFEIYQMLDPIEAKSVLVEADAVLMNCFEMTAEHIECMKKCRIISRFGVGYDNVDYKAAEKKGIWVSNVPDYASEDVSDQALALLLACIRRITYRDNNIRKGQWNIKNKRPGYRIKGSTLGLFGMGRIGAAFVRKASSLGLSKILVCDPYIERNEIIKAGATPVGFNELIESSDYISIHSPLTDETKHIFNKDVFIKMKNNSIIVNTSRGPVIKEDDLYWALESGEIAYAGIDVFEKEPVPSESKLFALDNLIMSDHAGWYSEESVEELKSKAAINILETFKAGKPVYPVNHPK